MPLVTLYCDESGSHHPNDRKGGRWLIGGFGIIGKSPNNKANRVLDKVFDHIIAQSWFQNLLERTRLRAGRDIDFERACPSLLNEGRPLTRACLHYTEIKIAIAGTNNWETDWRALADFDAFVLGQVAESDLVPVVSVHDGSKIPNTGVNYNSQCLAFVAWAFSLLMGQPQPGTSSKLLCNLAKHGDGIFQEALHTLTPAVFGRMAETALASLGAMDLAAQEDPLFRIMSIKKGELDALVLADILCGIARAKTDGAQSPAEARSVLRSLGFQVSTPMLDMPARRAFALESEGDIVRALTQHLTSGKPDEVGVVRLLARLLAAPPQHCRYAFDQVVDEIDRWSRDQSKSAVHAVCAVLLNALNALRPTLHRQLGTDFDAIVFRAAAYTLVWENHLGLEVKERLRQLDELAATLSYDVQLHESVSQFEVGRIEALINEHSYEEAAGRTKGHLARLERLSQLPSGKIATGDLFHGSNHTLRRAFTIDCRARLLEQACFLDVDDLELRQYSRDEIGDILRSIESVLDAGPDESSLTRSDRVRLLQLLAFGSELLAVHGSPLEAELTRLRRAAEVLCLDAVGEDAFGTAVAARAVATLALLEAALGLSSAATASLRRALQACCSHVGPVDHPFEIVLREGAFAASALFEPDDLASFKVAASVRLEAWRDQERTAATVFKHQSELCEQAIREFLQIAGAPEPGWKEPDSAAPTLPVKASQLLRARARSIY